MPASADTVTFTDVAGGTASFLGAVAEGTFVVVANDTTTPGQQATTGNANGWIYRVGNFLSNTAISSTWELAPGNDMYDAVYKPASAQTWVVGRGYDNPTSNNGVYSGPAQDIAVYTTFVTVTN